MQFSPEVLIVLGPLFAAAFAGLLQRYIGDKVAMALTTGSIGLSLVLSWPIFIDFVWGDGHERVIELFRFIDVAGFTSTWSVRIDTLSAIMLVVVNTVSFLVHVYSIGYMAEDPHRARFFSYLSFFTFSMLALVTANDFLQLFYGWEGVGVASYLLIGFWYHKRSANDASIKAFVTNRVGDFGFALGIMAAFFCYGSIEFNEVFHAAAAHPNLMIGVGEVQFLAVEVVAFLLFIGAMGKSAQFFLHVWLPDAMEGPTPVSALIHAATMVTAGVFMVSRCGELYHMAPLASGFVTIIGATTALFAATVGLAQNDIKRVIAYSTCSQLGYMFFAAGVGAYNAAMFHLFTHAFFKALLFLGAGSVIHGMHHEQDMRYMGGVRKPMQLTWAMMTIGTLALIGFGIPGIGGFAGFYSKDAIIEAAYGSHGIGAQFAFWCGISAALMTSFYSWRLAFMTFEGKYRGNPDDHAHASHDDHGHGHHAPADGSAPAHESPWVMLVPLFVLAAGAIAAGFVFAPYFLGEHAEGFWDHVIPFHAGHHDFPTWVLWAPLIVTVTGFLLAIIFYLWKPGASKAMAKGPLHAFLYNKWYFDEIYDFIFVKGARAFGDIFWKWGDQKTIDGLGPDGVAATSRFFSRNLRRLQTGFVYHYSFLMLIAAVAFGAYAIFAGIGGAP
ncbi:MAG: NADH-quinone oxidoreductase subunit L [Achromobacter sp.]|uniref:NADH-quinone oxidoreductase subunit L n=1 Tax=Achromobacter sp. TaxID=134375 RepID=UPI00258A162F|nr:NADH-quinone oxidoreductase subunit L [Achromobacter sp.]MCW0206945.1 NADH-quinone oxidoreductase subunit L [Achromobacter sp.]